MGHILRCILLLAIATVAACAQTKPAQAPAILSTQSSAVKVTYVGNEGVLLSHQGKAVLLDGLHREYKPDFLFPPPQLLSEMENGRPPFDQVRVILVSHVHLDHFHPESVGLHLKNNPKARLVSSSQTMLEIAKGYADHESVRTQMIEITPEWRQRRDQEVDGIKISALGLKHGTNRFWWVKNLGHIVEIGGKKFLHIGDADLTDENFTAFDLPKEKIDVAFVPYWFLLGDSGRKLVRETIAAKTVVAVHISPAGAQQEAERLRGLFPGVVPLVSMKQEIDF